MKTINRMLLASLLCMGMFAATAQPTHGPGMGGGHHAHPHGPAPEESLADTPEPQHHACQLMTSTVDFQSVKICYAPQMGAFVVVDSVECAIHLVKQSGDCLDTVASYKTDVTYKRHDLKNILRPVSVGFIGPFVVAVVSSVNDSAYVALLDQEMNVVARRDFSCTLYAMHFEHGQLFLVGRNPYGYDIHVLPMHGGLESFETAPTLSTHYRVAKQSEKIKQSDPVGIGLTAVAVAVVFLALVCIALILQGSGKLMMGMEERKKGKGAKSQKDHAIKPVSDGSNGETEIYAAIAAAIHLYNEELHDEEDTVITIQKVEREWTPWNAKYYNMNHYFNNRK